MQLKLLPKFMYVGKYQQVTSYISCQLPNDVKLLGANKLGAAKKCKKRVMKNMVITSRQLLVA